MPTATPRKGTASPRDPAGLIPRSPEDGEGGHETSARAPVTTASSLEPSLEPAAEGSAAAAKAYNEGAAAFVNDTERVDRAALAAAASEADDGLTSGTRSTMIRVRFDGKTWCVEHPTLLESPHFARLEAAEARANDLAKVLGAAIIVRGQDGELLATYPPREPE